MPTSRDVQSRLGDSPLYNRMNSGRGTRNELIKLFVEEQNQSTSGRGRSRIDSSGDGLEGFMLMDIFETTLPGHVVSTDLRRIDIDVLYDFLDHHSTWARGIPRSVVETAVAHSLNFGLYEDDGAGRMVAFCRVVTDYATFGNLVDVFVALDRRGRGLSKSLMSAVMMHPIIPGLRRFTLATTDAHSLYEKYGFTLLNKPETFMEIYRPGIYRT